MLEILLVSIQLICVCAPVDVDLFIVLQQGDVLKVDIGIHVHGRILDSAFTLNFDPTYDKLVEAVQAATNTGVRVSYILRPRSLNFMMSFHRKQE